MSENKQQTKNYNNKLTIKVEHFQYLLLGLSSEIDMNILIILLQPHIGNSFDDDWEMEWEDIVDGNECLVLGRK